MVDLFGGLSQGERSSAVMSGISSSNGQQSNQISIFGAQNNGFVDFTETEARGSGNLDALAEAQANMDAKAMQDAKDKEMLSKLKTVSMDVNRDRIIRAQRRAGTQEIMGEEIGKGLAASKIAALQAEAQFKSAAARFQRGAVGVVGQAGQFAGEGRRQQATFTEEQNMLGEMFGGGDKIWGTENNPVTLNNDLNSSRSDPFDETSSMFGFGNQGQRSGLF